VNPFFLALRGMPHTPRRVRRAIVVGTFIGYPLVLIGYSTLIATGRLSNLIWAPIAIVLMSLTALGAFAIYAFARERASLDEDTLDERQRQLRDQAHILSYVVLSTAVTLAAGAAAIWSLLAGSIVLDLGTMSPWFIALGLFLALLPAAMLAWIEPDELADESAA
jgi:hypothetical protein